MFVSHVLWDVKAEHRILKVNLDKSELFTVSTNIRFPSSHSNKFTRTFHRSRSLLALFLPECLFTIEVPVQTPLP